MPIKENNCVYKTKLVCKTSPSRQIAACHLYLCTAIDSRKTAKRPVILRTGIHVCRLQTKSYRALFHFVTHWLTDNDPVLQVLLLNRLIMSNLLHSPLPQHLLLEYSPVGSFLPLFIHSFSPDHRGSMSPRITVLLLDECTDNLPWSNGFSVPGMPSPALSFIYKPLQLIYKCSLLVISVSLTQPWEVSRVSVFFSPDFIGSDATGPKVLCAQHFKGPILKTSESGVRKGLLMEKAPSQEDWDLRGSSNPF